MKNQVDQIKNKTITLIERDKIRDEWLFERLENLLPVLMVKHNFDMWVTLGREYHEDPVAITLFPSSIDSSRRLTIFVFIREKDSGHVNRFVISSNKEYEPYYTCCFGKKGEGPFEVLRKLMDMYQPDQIAINQSPHYSFCDGLSHTFYQILQDTIGMEHSSKLVSSAPLAIDWLQLRIEPELETYKDIALITRDLAKLALSEQVIKAKHTTTREVVNWIRQKTFDLGLKTSFYPTVDIQRQGSSADRIEGIIQHGDIVHLDFGIEYLGLCSDTQQVAYVLYPGEHEVPKGLRKAFATANQFEDIVMDTFQLGMSGNEVFEKVMMIASEKGISAMLYSHPIGYHCHAAGPLIGLFDKQESIPVRGELEILNHTCYALEFNIRAFIPEWNKDVPIYLEESVCFKHHKLQYLTKRQTEFYVIPSSS
ncbi:M24 family metallopeptidase [Fictibacillus phosphorivorans]|uniref:M24 family metallopeptidase n=1 Tax=Fictibacillus phosphorivorans TaxID=1221500 RepID=UPI00203AC6D1|nr:M24 family metallopeptidase [Fictibacillus phosphorivorans]MCM3776953.1 M24 family metallopeptidase [Fictibacillus phosphorivorans]